MKKKWKEFYGRNIVISAEEGIIDFSPDAVGDIVGAENMSYDQYLEIATKPDPKARTGFARCFFESCLTGFKGRIQKFSRNKEYVCFELIFISGMYMDGTLFQDKEDHVWMERKGFEGYKANDCLTFEAEAYRYLKKSNGLQIDYAIRDPWNIEKISDYELPTDEQLIRQELQFLECEVCIVHNHCDGVFCLKG